MVAIRLLLPLLLLLLLAEPSRCCSFLVTTREVSDFNHVNYHLKFRGPDHTSQLRHRGLLFVHNLLHMTGAKTPQPLRSADDSVWLVYNGEIYNAAEFGEFESLDPDPERRRAAQEDAAGLATLMRQWTL